jgi:phosphoesterase RecJ-like protein
MEEIGIDDGETKALSNFLNAMIDTDSTLVLKETAEGDVKGSLRAISKNVREIAEKYGGGGHDLAAGFKITGAYLEEQDGEWKIMRKE